MNATTQPNAWLQTSLGQRHEIPQTDEYPIVVGRVRGEQDSEGRVEIPQSNATMTVSRAHAHIWWSEAEGWEIADAGSSHGLFLNGEKIAPGERHPLEHGAKVQLGKFPLAFQIEGEAQDPEQAATAMGEDGEDTGATMVMTDFVAAQQAPDFDAAIPDEAEEPAEQIYADAWLEDKPAHIGFPQIPGVNAWTIGRAVRKPPKPTDSELVDHIQVPNTPETKSVSRKHARLTRTAEDAWRVQSLSAQGIRVNGRKVAGEDEAALEYGDKISLGGVVFILRKGPLETEYSAEVFAPAAARAGEGLDPDETPTREVPRDLFVKSPTSAQEDEPWGYLVENKLLDPRKYALTKRKTRIGSHPLNSDIKMEGAGITDNYAVIQWGAKDPKIHSKSGSSPVRVDHSPYRSSPPLKDGATITLGTREYTLQIVGIPPVSTSELITAKTRRSILLFIIVIVLSAGGGLGGIKFITPTPGAGQLAAEPGGSELIEHVLTTEGLAGLALLRAGPANQGEEGRDNQPIFKALEDLNEAHRMIHKVPAKFFTENVPKIDARIESGKRVFELAGLSASLSEGGWFAKDIDEVFEARRESAYATQWKDFLEGLEHTNIANAKKMLDELTHFPPKKLQAARRVVSVWQKSAKQTLKKNEDDILREFREACRQSRSYDYIESEGERLDALVANYDSIKNDPSEPAQALTRSEKWTKYHNHVTALRFALSLLEYYQDGEGAKFRAIVEQIRTESQTKLMATMKDNLGRWEAWNRKFDSDKDPLSNFKLLSELQQVQLAFKGTLDDKCKLSITIEQRIASFTADRVSEADRLRKEADTLPDNFEKYMKLVAAYNYDPADKAGEKLDMLGARLCGAIVRDGTAAANKENLKRALDRCNALIAKGVMNPDAIVSRRQMQKILDSIQ